MPRGGRRPGAGAPRGNLNALKTGKYSPRARRVIESVLADPEARAALVRLGLRPQPPERISERKRRTEAILRAAGAPPPLDLGERHQRLLRRMRRLRAMVTARLERDQRRKDSWRILLDEERARLAAVDESRQDGHERPQGDNQMPS